MAIKQTHVLVLFRFGLNHNQGSKVNCRAGNSWKRLPERGLGTRIIRKSWGISDNHSRVQGRELGVPSWMLFSAFASLSFLQLLWFQEMHCKKDGNLHLALSFMSSE